MKWYIETPEINSEREIKKFAFIPVMIDNYILWLEFYYVLKKYSSITVYKKNGSTGLDYKWVVKNKYQKNE